MNRLKYFPFAFIFTLFIIQAAIADEGMYPLSEIQKLNLKAHGLKVTPKDIYNPGHTGLIDAIVQIGGCTGSFVSPEGLIITNHHCSFGAVQAASTPEHDYLTEGFLAREKKGEILAKGFTARITDSYKDVSREVLSAVSDTMDVLGRSKAIDKRIKEIVAETEKEHPGKRAEISEMFAGKTYMLFIYTFMKDVRLVYVPPRSIGEFGGEDDNWAWPRHTGDFSFLRVYVGPDGNPADYSTSNIPYHPKKYLKVAPQGAEENDPVFILGYPGRTFRHRTSHFLSFENDIRMPYVADLFAWEIATMENLEKNDPTLFLKLDGRIKSLANTMKNYRGKLKGLKHIPLIEKKQEEEKAMQAFIDKDPKRKEQYGDVLNGIDTVYRQMRARAQFELTFDYLFSSSSLFSYGLTIVHASQQLKKPDIERESGYMEKNFAQTRQNLKSGLRNFYPPVEKIFFKEMLTRAIRLPIDQRIAVLDSLLGPDTTSSGIDAFISRLYENSKLNDTAFIQNALSGTPEEMESLHDSFIDLARLFYGTYQDLKVTRQKREGTLNKLYARLVDVKAQFMKKDFIPDANSTLRLTFGRVKGYSPADALYSSPITTLRGVIEKTTGIAPFYNTPAKIVELYKTKNLGKYKNKKLKDVPVCLLYNLDTTGGSSGSPLLNASGELIGVNFDRAYEATINDYAWSEDYSRSISVDIRYVLFVLDKLSGAENVLNELGVNN
jgi:hypothetical protein